jgi:CRISP-associated protein Cas1
MAYCVKLVTRKIEGCDLTLEKAVPRSAPWEKAMQRAYDGLTRLGLNPPRDIVALRGLEAGCAAAYFRAWKAVPLRCVGTKRRAIPEAWRTVGPRASPNKVTGNRNAKQPINAMLNYAYGVLESETRIRAVAEGYDPARGIMHDRQSSDAGFIFDLMEPERPQIDRVVLEFVRAHALHPADFTIRADGVCRLNPEMARRLVHSIATAGN